MTAARHLTLAAIALSLPSCSLFKKDEPNYDTPEAANGTANPYGVPDSGGGEAVPYQPVNPPADNPTYSRAAYEDTAAQPPTAAGTPAHSAPAHATPAPAASTSHTVAKGDTLGGIAKRYGVSSAAIKQANGMTSDTVVLGKTLAIPGASGPVSRPAPTPAAGGASHGGKVHTVVKGDSLAKISRQHGVTMDAIKKANNMSNDTVVLGTKLRIP